MPWYLGNSQSQSEMLRGAGFGLLAIWSVIWTGLALWNASKREHKGWFIFFLLVHTMGIVEFIYLKFIAKIFNPAVKHQARKKK